MWTEHFHWYIDGVELPEGGLDIFVNKKGFEKELNTLFLEAHDRGSDALNVDYEGWNEEYDALYGFTPYEEYCKSYPEFISKKHNEILKEVPDDVFELFTDPEFGQYNEYSICGRLKNVHNAEVKVTVVFEEV